MQLIFRYHNYESLQTGTYFSPGKGACGGDSGDGDMIVAASGAMYDSLYVIEPKFALMRLADIRLLAGLSITRTIVQYVDGN